MGALQHLDMEALTVQAAFRQFDKMMILDAESTDFLVYTLNAGIVIHTESGSFDEHVIEIARQVPRGERLLYLKQLDLANILDALKKSNEYIVSYRTEEGQFFKLTFHFLDDSGKRIFATRQNESSYSQKLRLTEESLRRDSERFYFLVDSICDYFIEADIKTGASTIISGRESIEVKEHFHDQIVWFAENLIAPDQREAFLQEFKMDCLLDSIRRNDGNYSVQFDTMSGNMRRRLHIVSTLFTKPYSPDDGNIFSYARDITELRRQEEKNEQLIDISQKLLNLSQTDPLTGLYNRAAGEKIISEHLSQSSIGCHGTMLLIDIDYFKNCNDRYGHQTGDYVLQYFSRTMRDIFRSDDVLCRWGGDEFIVFMRNVGNIKSIQARLARLSDRMRECRMEDDTPIPITLSIGGVVAVRQNILSVLFDEVDHRLYDVKKSGRNGILITQEL